MEIWVFYGGKGWYSPRDEDLGLCYYLVESEETRLEDLPGWPNVHVNRSWGIKALFERALDIKREYIHTA